MRHEKALPPARGAPSVEAFLLVCLVESLEFFPKRALGVGSRFAGLLRLEPRLLLRLDTGVLHALRGKPRMHFDLGRVQQLNQMARLCGSPRFG